MLYGNVLKKLRDNNKIKQKELAKILNINENLYCMYEKEYQIIPLKHLNELCNFYNVSLDYIFEFTDKPQYDNAKDIVDKVTAGLRLKNFRKEHKLTQVKLAEKLNIVNTIISEYEKGNFLISTHALYSICKKYQVSADYLLGKIDYNPLKT